MRPPRLIRCGSVLDGDRCGKLRYHPGWHAFTEGSRSHSWGRDADRRQTYETDAPWVMWTWLSSDRETRITGRSRFQLTCCICGDREIVRIPIPRFGTVPTPANGRHPARVAAVERHAHPEIGQNRADWALPFGNPFATGGLDLAMIQRVVETAKMEAEDA